MVLLYGFFVFSLFLWFVGLGLILKTFKKFLVTGIFLVTLTVIGEFLSSKILTFTIITTFFVLVTVGVFLAKKRYGKLVDPLLIGWVLLTITNTLFVLEVPLTFYLDLPASFAKIIIAYGILNPNFFYVGTHMAAFLKKASSKPCSTRAHFTLVKCEKASRLKELNWLKQIIEDNLTDNLKTTLVTVYDSISTTELADLEFLSNKNIGLIRVLREVKEQSKSSNITLLKDDLTSIGLLFSNLIAQNRKEPKDQVLIIYPLSWLILTHGWKNMYLLLSSKISELKETKTHLIAFYYPNTHSDKTIHYTLEKMAEQIISI